ncbi:MAG: hypothetical protein ACYTHJ_12695 [Planctomycetota bacterium]|jgi:hypothetical protein
MTRRNYYYEFRQFLAWSVLAGIVEGNFGSVVVSKSFGASEWLIALATATPIAAFTFSLVWGMLAVGRPKVRLLITFSAGTAFLTGMAGAVPNSPWGAWWFILQMAAAQILMAGVLTTRSALWKSNYPKEVRGQVTAKLQRIRFIVSAVTSLTAAAICDRNPDAYQYVYPIVAGIGISSIWMARKIRVRGERSQLAHLDKPRTNGDLPTGLVEPFSLTALISPGHVFGQMLRVLRTDASYRKYCLAQFLMGIANLMTISIVAAVITTRLEFGPHWGFWISTVLLVGFQQLGLLASLGRWGHLFDRVGVLSFRVINVSCWTASLVMGMAATVVVVYADSIGPLFLPLAVLLFATRALLAGLARGGGALAWHIGHLHFASGDEAEIYMGIHVFLTGVRGMIAPLGGIWLWSVMGWPVWIIAVTLSSLSLIMYWIMAREERQNTQDPGAES